MGVDLLVLGSAPGTASGAARLGLSVSTAPDLLRSARHVHAASFYLLPELAAELAGKFKEAKAVKAPTSLAPGDDPSGRWDRIMLDPVLRVTDYLLLDAAEALGLTGHHSVVDAAGILARRGPLVVIRDHAFTHNGTRVTSKVSAGGAGAGFDAGWVAAVLNGLRPDRALEIAAACGSLSTRAAGAPTWEEVTA